MLCREIKFYPCSFIYSAFFFNGLFPCHFSFGLGLLARCPCSILLLVVSDSARFASNNTCNPRLASRSATWRATDHDGDGDGEDFSYQLVTLTCPITLVVCADDEIDEETKEKSQDALLAFGHVLRKS